MEPDFAPKELTKQWRQKKYHPFTSTWSNENHKDAQELFPVFLEIIKRFRENGVLLAAGTDMGTPWITPGVSLHHEYELLVKAGIPTLEVIKIATHNGAKWLGILDEVGTIEVGKQADLVILNANPIENIKNTREIELVVKRGEIFYPSELLSK